MGSQMQAPLDEALHHLRMSGTFYCQSEFEAPWGLSFPATPGEARFHAVTGGRAVLRGPGIDPRPLNEGDLVLLPQGAGHELAHDHTSPVRPCSEIRPEYSNHRYAQFRIRGGGPGTSLVCVKLDFDDPTAQRLVSMLPRVIHVPAGDSSDHQSIKGTVGAIATEASGLRPGGETMITRLADVLIIQAIRWWIEHEPESPTGWLTALRDRQIGRIIMLIHRHPAHPWSVGALAAEAAMSRSALTSRFKQLVGESVMGYITGWRMHIALRSLRQGRMDIGKVAEQVGYQSESAFNRAFKRRMGVSPGAVRNGAALSV
jgi:AraC-like DNA-binding protein